MPPKLALIFCIIFISIALIIDRKKPEASFTLWIPLIWVMLSGSKSLGRWFYTGPTIATIMDDTAGDPLNRTVLLILIILGLLILFKRKIDWSEIAKRNAWVFILFIYMGLSVLWSDFLGLSFKRWVRTSGNLIMALVVLTEANPVESVKRLFRRCGYVLIPLSVLFIKYFRQIGVAYDFEGKEMWVGVTTHKNTLGELCLVIAIFFLWKFITMWGTKNENLDSKQVFLDIFILLLTLRILLFGGEYGSATSTAVFLMGLCLFLLIPVVKKNLKRINTLIISIGVIFIFLQLSFDIVEVGAALLGRDSTLTGRTLMWTEILKLASQQPFLGAGYGNQWHGDILQHLMNTLSWVKNPGTGHSGYIDVYFYLGLCGLFLLAGVIVFSYRHIVETLPIDFNFAMLRLVLFIGILIHNIAESSFTHPSNLLWFVFLLVSVEIPKKKAFVYEKKLGI